jgi:DNA polymerase I-like protein with 3'-5' exonuclease and polymerase domains
MLTSLYTRRPYYKDEGKATGKGEKKTLPPDAQEGHYSCLDAAVTNEVYQAQLCCSVYTERKKTIDFEMALVNGPIKYMMRRGVRINVARKELLKKRYETELNLLELLIAQETGGYVNLRSPAQVAAVFYDRLKLKGGVNRSTDANSIYVLKAKYPDCAAVAYLAQHRKIAKICDNILSAGIDGDERMRSTYSPTTTTGRFKSYKNPYGIGVNAQNIVRIDNDPNIRPLFIADDDCYLVEADLSQAELRWVAYEAGADNLIEKLENPVANFDIHRWNAARIFNKAEADITKAERELGKRIIHAGNYLMGARALVKVVRIGLGLNLTETVARSLLESYFKMFPAVKRWHANILKELNSNNKTLINSFGRVRKFYESFQSNLLPAAVAFKPQSGVAELLNHIMLNWFNKYNDNSILHLMKDGLMIPYASPTQSDGTHQELLIQLHDAFYTQCPKSRIKAHIESLKECFNYPITIGRYKDRVIPCNIKVTEAWGGKEIKLEA